LTQTNNSAIFYKIFVTPSSLLLKLFSEGERGTENLVQNTPFYLVCYFLVSKKKMTSGVKVQEISNASQHSWSK
tara:strand:- start:50 stop:271 length:222 start_codon:yes stop_codon:yes gene_type:complete